MDIFAFKNPVFPTRMEQGSIINKLRSKLWIERYRDAGEFKLVAEADSGIREKLPIGSFVSHTNSTDIMIVENHEVSESQDKESEIVVTGRSFEAYFENRVVGTNRTFLAIGGTPPGQPLNGYPLPNSYSWEQAMNIVNNHTLALYLQDDDNEIPFFDTVQQVSGTFGTSAPRTVQYGNLYERVLDLLEIDNLGMKTIRPGPWSPIAPTNKIVFAIHKGTDKTATINLSYESGEIESADYLWSNKKFKNAALITGKWVATTAYLTPGLPIKYDRRTMHITANDIDDYLTATPSTADATVIAGLMQTRGYDILKSQNNITLTKAEPAKETNKFVYRRDYDLGDLVTVSGNYNGVSTMRVSEFVEIEDETGENGYPTLTVDEES